MERLRTERACCRCVDNERRPALQPFSRLPVNRLSCRSPQQAARSSSVGSTSPSTARAIRCMLRSRIESWPDHQSRPTQPQFPVDDQMFAKKCADRSLRSLRLESVATARRHVLHDVSMEACKFDSVLLSPPMLRCHEFRDVRAVDCTFRNCLIKNANLQRFSVKWITSTCIRNGKTSSGHPWV